MQRVRLSPSKIEQFRKLYEGEYNGFITTEKVIDYISGKTGFSEEMDFGKAFDCLIEFGPERYWDDIAQKYVVTDDEIGKAVFFTQNEISEILRYRSTYPNMIYECSWKHEFHVGKYVVDCNMRLDGLNGLDIHERKTLNQNSVDVEMYMRSYQWRIYLLAMKARYVQYDIFTIHQTKDMPEKKITWHDLKFYRDANIQNDVENMIKLTIEFCLDHKLEKFIFTT